MAFESLLANPFLNIGAGLLSQAGPSYQPTSIGRGLLVGLQSANQAQAAQLRNEAIRRQLAANARRQAALDQLQGILGAPIGGGQVGPTRAAAARMNAGMSANEAMGGPSQDQRMLGLLAQVSPDAFAKGLLAQMGPQQPTTFQQNYEFLASQGNSPAEILKALGHGGTTVNVGNGQADKPISVPDLKNMMLPDGSTPPIGTTYGQAAKMGAKVVTTQQQSTIESANKFQAVIDRLSNLALGTPDAKTGVRTGGVFSNIEPGLFNRGRAAWDMFTSSLDQNQPNLSAYDSFSKGTVAPLIRSLGDKGALSDTDVQRGLNLLPQIHDNFMLPDTRSVAANKLKQLSDLIQKGTENLQKQQGMTFKVKPESKKMTGITAKQIANMSIQEINNLDLKALSSRALDAVDARLKELGL